MTHPKILIKAKYALKDNWAYVPTENNTPT